MDAILGGFAFAALIVGQFAAVVAVHGQKEREAVSSEGDYRGTAIAPQRTDYRARMIWEGGS